MKKGNAPTTSEFLLLARGRHWEKVLSPEEIQKIIGRSDAWFDQLAQQGKAELGSR